MAGPKTTKKESNSFLLNQKGTSMPEMKTKVVVNGDEIEFFYPLGEKAWSLRTPDIVLIAEFTTDEGPWIDDWFLEFVTKGSAGLCFFPCSMYAEGIEMVQDYLDRLHAIPQLVTSAEWDSRVIWPAVLEGKPYFEFSDVAATSIRARMRRWFLGPVREYKLSAELRKYLGMAPARG